jgi:hypothetical protein
LASPLWRLDHDRLAIDEHSVIILDEVGMTEDADLVALAAASRPRAPNWCSSATIISSVPSARARRWPRWSAATPTSSTS